MSLDRRTFFKHALHIGTLAFVGQLLQNEAFAAEAPLLDMSGKSKDPLIKQALPTAKNLNYVEDLKAALKAKKINKSDMKDAKGKVYKPEEQTCETCQFYIAKTADAGGCTLILGGRVLVEAKGSCISWVAKA